MDKMAADKFSELVRVMRGGVVDNVHRGCVAVADTDGQVLFSLGDPDYRAFIRSSAKPLQTMALVELGGMEAFGFDEAELAIICASHSGGDVQIRAVRRVLEKIGLDESALRAGSGIRDNCSGKHAGMLALAKLRGYPIEGYTECGHPIQSLILERISALCGLPTEEIDVAVDGCGAPIFAMPLRNMALGYARLANFEWLPKAGARAARQIVQAVQNHPELVGGLDFRGICGKKVVAKSGASGCYCAGFRQKGLGLALKIADGAPEPILPLFFEVARHLKLIGADEFARFAATHPPVVENRCGEVVGELQVVFGESGSVVRKPMPRTISTAC